MDLMIFSGNYMYFTDLIFEVAVLILLLLICISLLGIMLHYIVLLIKKLHLKLYPYKTAKIAPIPLANVTDRRIDDSVEHYVIEVNLEQVDIIS
jgi:hypothetical protein